MLGNPEGTGFNSVNRYPFSKLFLYARRHLFLGLITGLLVSTAERGYAQSPYSTIIDSLQTNLAAKALTDSLRIEYLNRLAREYAYISSAQASLYAEQALELSLSTHNKAGEAYAYRNLGSIYAVQESFYLSLEFTSKALQLFERLGDSTGIGNCYITLGHTYKNQQEYTKAVDFHRRAVAIFRHQHLPERLAVGLHNLGEAQLLAGKLDSSWINTQEAIHLCRTLNNQSVLSACYRVLGAIYYRRNDFARAQEIFQNVILISERLGANAQNEATTESLIYLARLAERQNQPQRQIDYLKRAIRLANAKHYTQFLRTGYQLAGKYYLAHHDVAAAQRLLEEYSQVVEENNRWQNKDKSAMIETVLNALKLSEQNRFLAQQSQLEKQIIDNQRRQLIWVSIAAAFVTVVLAAVLYSYRRRQQLIQQVLSQKSIIEQNARELEITTQKLRQMNQVKNKFFKIVAHDLISPLSSMSGVATLLSEDSESLSKEETSWILKRWNQTLHSTLELAHNLINWAHSQMDATPPHSQSIALYPLLDKIKNIYSSMAYQKEIDLQVQFLDYDAKDSVQVYADADQIEFVIRNLVNNALKFTPRNGQVYIQVHNEGQTTVISVIDTGIGLSPEKLEHLFSIDKFQRTEGTEGEQGSGMGLVLCQEFIQKNNGTIRVESHQGEGTRVFVYLPSGVIHSAKSLKVST